MVIYFVGLHAFTGFMQNHLHCVVVNADLVEDRTNVFFIV